MISGKTLDLWNQQYFISKYVYIVMNYIESFQMMRCNKLDSYYLLEIQCAMFDELTNVNVIPPISHL